MLHNAPGFRRERFPTYAIALYITPISWMSIPLLYAARQRMLLGVKAICDFTAELDADGLILIWYVFELRTEFGWTVNDPGR